MVIGELIWALDGLFATDSTYLVAFITIDMNKWISVSNG